MTKKRADLRVDEELLTWADRYADERGVSRTAIFEAGLKSLREDASAGVPDLEVAPPPAPKQGTEHWRDPTEEELRRARSRYPHLPDDRLFRLARAEARMADQGMPQIKKASEMTRKIAKGYRTPDGQVGEGGGDFEQQTAARGKVFDEGGFAATAQKRATGGTIGGKGGKGES